MCLLNFSVSAPAPWSNKIAKFSEKISNIARLNQHDYKILQKLKLAWITFLHHLVEGFLKRWKVSTQQFYFQEIIIFPMKIFVNALLQFQTQISCLYYLSLLLFKGLFYIWTIYFYWLFLCWDILVSPRYQVSGNLINLNL